jgi:CRP-like cAMP-binding protein
VARSEPQRAEMFPALDDAAIDRMRPAGHERAFHTGEILLEQGEASSRLFVVLEGASALSL